MFRKCSSSKNIALLGSYFSRKPINEEVTREGNKYDVPRKTPSK